MTILITGANRGIGRGLFETYREAGEEALGTARAAEGQGDFLPLDVADPASIEDLGQALDGQPLDLLVCNAGVYLDKSDSIDDGYNAEAWAQSFAVNVSGVFLTVQALLPNLRAGGGRIAIIASKMGQSSTAPGGSYIYRASKAAAINLGLNLASDLRHEGIAVGVYHPGHVSTDMGGRSAPVSVDQSVKGLKAQFEALSLETTGQFLNYDGTRLSV